jgi:hypothetical protein
MLAVENKNPQESSNATQQSHVVGSGAPILDGLHRQDVYGQALRFVEQVPLLLVAAAVAVVAVGRLQPRRSLLDVQRVARYYPEHDHLARVADV